MTPRPSWPPEPLVTARLTLRDVVPGDVAPLIRLWTDQDAWPWRLPFDQEQVEARSRGFVGRPGKFSATLTASGAWLGLVSLDGGVAEIVDGLRPTRRPADQREVSYAFLPGHWNRGYAREAVSAVVGWTFAHLPAEFAARVIATTDHRNVRSRHLLDAIGMTRIDAGIEAGSAAAGQAAEGAVIYAVDRPFTA
jgi:RimJ/RimL family protein N-acetyltransferase